MANPHEGPGAGAPPVVVITTRRFGPRAVAENSLVSPSARARMLESGTPGVRSVGAASSPASAMARRQDNLQLYGSSPSLRAKPITVKTPAPPPECHAAATEESVLLSEALRFELFTPNMMEVPGLAPGTLGTKHFKSAGTFDVSPRR